MNIEEKRKAVLNKRIAYLKSDINSFLKTEIENEYYGKANYLQGKLAAVEDILTLIDMTYNRCNEHDLDEWLEFNIE